MNFARRLAYRFDGKQKTLALGVYPIVSLADARRKRDDAKKLLVSGIDPSQQVTVFVPTNNLYLGDVIVVPKEETLPTGLTVEEGIRIILSAGTATPPRLPRERL